MVCEFSVHAWYSISWSQSDEQGEEIVLVNPVISKSSKIKETDEEGCLSFPGIYAQVQRPVSVKVKAQDLQGKKITLQLKDFDARVFQHEFDHLQVEKSLFLFLVGMCMNALRRTARQQ